MGDAQPLVKSDRKTVSFINFLLVFNRQVFISLFKFIPSYLIIYVAPLDGFYFLLSFSDNSLVV